MGHLLAVVGKAKSEHGVNEQSCEIQFPAIFAGGIVTGEGVVVIVEAFSNSSKSDKGILHWIDEAVVRLVAIEMG